MQSYVAAVVTKAVFRDIMIIRISYGKLADMFYEGDIYGIERSSLLPKDTVSFGGLNTDMTRELKERSKVTPRSFSNSKDLRMRQTHP